MSLGRLLAAQRRYLRAETFHLSSVVRFLRAEAFQLSLLFRAGLGAGRRLWITAGVRQYGHLLATPAHGGHSIESLGQRLIIA